MLRTPSPPTHLAPLPTTNSARGQAKLMLVPVQLERNPMPRLHEKTLWCLQCCSGHRVALQFS